MSYDLVTIGGGFSGLVSAARAAELGLRVAVLEARAEDRYPCSSRYTTGVSNVMGLAILAEPDVLYRAIVDGSGGTANPALARAVADNGKRAIDWLASQGARFITRALQKDQPGEDAGATRLSRNLSHRCAIFGILRKLRGLALHLKAGDELGIGSAGAADRGQPGAAITIGRCKRAPLLGKLIARCILALQAAVDILLHAENTVGACATAWGDIEFGYLVGDQHGRTDCNRGEDRNHRTAPGCWVRINAPRLYRVPGFA